MHMEIIFDEEKVVEKGLTLNGLYEKIDEIAKKYDITKKEGLSKYIGNNNNNDYGFFGGFQFEIKDIKDILYMTKSWIWYIDDTNIEDVKETITLINTYGLEGAIKKINS